jgi:Nuclease A inhibitor-like protein
MARSKAKSDAKSDATSEATSEATPEAPSDAAIVELLTAATTDLYWVSESDEPFTVLLWADRAIGQLDCTSLAQQIAADSNTPIAPVNLDEFFQPATTVQDWHEAADRAIVDRYIQLRSTLSAQLSALQVYRVGSGEVDIYIVGKTPAGHWLALKTLVVES